MSVARVTEIRGRRAGKGGGPPQLLAARCIEGNCRSGARAERDGPDVMSALAKIVGGPKGSPFRIYPWWVTSVPVVPRTDSTRRTGEIRALRASSMRCNRSKLPAASFSMSASTT
jgi:hypothetical protein